MNYLSSFVGIPLPEEFKFALRQLNERLILIMPELNIADVETSHITLYFLGNQKAEVLEKVFAEIRDIPMPVGAWVSLSGAGVFDTEKSKALYIKAQLPAEILELREKLKKILTRYRPDDPFEFEPHLTIARVNERDIEKLAAVNDKITHLLNNVSNWNFPLPELAIYGRDPHSNPPKPTKIYSIK
jgi:2'-5' RNA ligase